jgi:hypothetical protein
MEFGQIDNVVGKVIIKLTVRRTVPMVTVRPIVQGAKLCHLWDSEIPGNPYLHAAYAGVDTAARDSYTPSSNCK